MYTRVIVYLKKIIIKTNDMYSSSTRLLMLSGSTNLEGGEKSIIRQETFLNLQNTLTPPIINTANASNSSDLIANFVSKEAILVFPSHPFAYLMRMVMRFLLLDFFFIFFVVQIILVKKIHDTHFPTHLLKPQNLQIFSLPTGERLRQD